MTILANGEHLREAKRLNGGGFCTRGVAVWFKRYDLNLRDFLTTGIPVEQLEDTGDELGMKVARIARERAQSGK